MFDQSHEAAVLVRAADEALSEVRACAEGMDAMQHPLLSEFLFSVQTAAEYAGTGETPEQRIHLFVEHLGLDCSQLLTSTAIALIVDLFDIIPYDYLIVRILAAATLLCYLGVF
ncbi:MAG: hypothetical protein N3B18_07525 [Desulfobacterota bacterium]|nr:hypothetical protein [Thermodesulfobacteriota bacterium]